MVLAAHGVPEVAFAVPEALIRQVRADLRAVVEFDAIPGEPFAGTVTEVGVASSALGTTFPVTVRLDGEAPEIRSGMAAIVELAFPSEVAFPRFLLPGHAVGEDPSGRFVFVAEPTADGLGVVRRRPVTVGAFAAEGLEVSSGIAEGDLVVTAGLGRLQGGETVRLDAPGTP